MTATLAALGSRRVYVYLRDRAYNITAAATTATISYSTTAPATATLAVTDPTTSSNAHSRQSAITVAITGDTGAVKWCLSETQTTAPAYGTSTCTGGAGATSGWHTTRPTSFTLSTGDVAKTIYLWTADVSNNVSTGTVTDSITLDTLPPAVAFVTLTDTTSGSTSVTNQTPADLSIQYDTDATAWCSVEQAFATATPSAPAWNSGCWVTTRPTSQALGATGIRRTFIFTKDVAHNVSPAPGVSQINYTTTPPSDPTLSLSNPTMGSTTITKDLLVTASIGSPTGTVKWCLSETQTTKPATGSIACTGGAGPDSGWYSSLPSTFTLSGTDALKTVYIWVADTANNVNANAVTATITLDTTAPATPTVAMTDPNTSSATQTNQFSVNLSITADTDAVRWCPMIQANADAAPAAPLVSDSCWRSTRPTVQLIDATGLRKLYVFTRDTAGNVGAAGTATITYSTVLPADPTITLADDVTALADYAKQTALDVSITGDTGAVRWCLSETQSTRPALGTSTCTGGTGPSSGWFTARPTTFTLSAGEALKRVYIWTADISNNVNANSTNASITYDTTAPAAPSVAMADPNTNSSTDTNQSTVTLTIGATADALAWCVIEQANATAAPAAPAFGDACFNTTKPTTQALGATGVRKIYVYTRDRAYNVSAAAAVTTISYSTTAPATATLALSDATTSSTSHVRQLSTAASITGDTGAVKWCLSETQTTQPALGTSACTGGTGASNGWLTTRPTTFSLTSSDALKTVYLWTADSSNTTSATAATDTIPLDTSTPSIPTVSLADQNTANTAFTNLATANLSITGDTDATSWCVFEQALATAAPTAPLYSNACWVGTLPTTRALAAQGDRRVYVYTKDVAHNISVAAAVATINYDTSSPSDPVLVLSNSVTGSRLYTNDRDVAVSINNPAGAVKWCISETQTTQPANGTTACTGGAGPSSGWYTAMPSTYQLSNGDALKTVYIWVADASNNTNSNASSTTITLLQTPPSAPTVALADPNTSSATETNQSSVTLTVTVDTGATAWCAIAQAGAAAAPATPAVSSTCWTLTRPTSIGLGATGARKVYVFLRDAAMNVSAAGSTTITLDTTAPADPTLAIAHATTGLSTYAKSTALAITIGNDAAATRWCVSESQSVKPQLGTSTCVGGSGGSSGWYTARPTTFTLSGGDGNKRVYVWVANSSNNVSDTAISQTIVLDTAAPGALTISGVNGGGDTIADQYLGTTTTATLHWSAAAGASVYKVKVLLAADDSEICAEQTTAAVSYTFAGCTLVDGTSYKAVVTAYDTAENTTAATNQNFAFAVSLTPPGAFSITGASGSQDTTADQWAGTSLPTVGWAASASVYQYIVQVLANDGTTVMCTQQVKSAASLSHDFSTTGCSTLGNDTNFKIDVIAKDVAGNTRTASNNAFVFRTDTTAPVVAISSTPASQAIVNTAAFIFAGTDTISGVYAMDCRRDAGAYAACDTATDKSYTGLAEGAHSFDVRVTDNVGLTHTASYSWALDTIVPGSMAISGATGATDAIVDNELRNDNKIIAHWTDSSSEDYYEVTILNAADDTVACPMVTKAANSTSHSFSTCVLDTNDDYKIKVVAKRGYGTSYSPTPMTITTPTDTITATVSLAASVASGSGTTVTLVTYLNGVQLSTGGLNPTFSLTGAGTSTGTFGAVSYIGSGTYQATFTGVLAGTAVDITATSGGTAFASVTTDAISVTPGAVSAATSLVAVSSSTVQADNVELSNITVTLKDAAGNLISGKTVTASHAGGTGTGAISAFTDNSNGTYSGTFSGRVSGTATTVTAVGDGVTITQTQNITVFAGPPTKIAASGATALTAHACAGPYTVTLRDYWNNLAQAQSNVQINFGGIGGGNYSALNDCTTTLANTTIFLGGSTGAPVYAMARAPSASTDLTFSDNATTLSAATLTVSVSGVPVWLGTTGTVRFNETSGMPSRSNMDGLQSPRGVWVDEAANLMYVADGGNHRIVRYDLATTSMTGWIGRVNAIDGLAGTGCTALTSGQATPGWCTGGTSQASGGTVLDGMYNVPVDITGDDLYLYIIDSGNNRIVRVTKSTGAFSGWYGRVLGTTSLGGAAGCSALLAGNPTPGWCTGGTSQASAGTNWNGMFSGPLVIKFYDDPTDGKLLFVNDATNNRIVRLNVEHATLVTWNGWIGRIGATVPTGNGVNYPTAVPAEQCTALTTNNGARHGYCTGGTTLASLTGSSLTLAMTNYDGMFNAPRGLAIVPGTVTYAYVADTTNNRYVRFNIQTGASFQWAGRSTSDAPATGGNAGCGVYNTIAQWCTGGAPIWTNYCFPNCPSNTANQTTTARYISSLFTDGSYLYSNYSVNSDYRTMRSSFVDPLTYVWVGRVGTLPTSGTGCSTTSLGFPTPGWCGGGGANRGFGDGHFWTTGNGYADVTHDRMYMPDLTLNKVQAHVLSTGASAGWIGSKATTSPTNWSTSYTPGLVGNVGYPEDLSFGAGYSGVLAMAGLANYNGELYVADTGNTRLKRYNSNTGSFLGWYGRSNVVPTGPDDTCTGITSGAVTPIWCTGGTSQAIGTGGTGELGQPRGIAADATYLYVADSNQARVVRITRTGGSFAGWLGRTGVSPTSMSGFDAAGNVTCPALGTNQYTNAWCAGGNIATGTGDGALNNPYGVAVDPTGGILYVTDTSNSRISAYNASTAAFIGWIGRVNSVVALGGGAGCAATTTGNSTPAWCTGGTAQNSAGTAAFSGFNGPRGVAFAVVAGTNTLFVADTGINRVHRVNATTGAVQGWIGRVNSVAGLGGGAGCAATTTGNPTPAWCTGGSPQATGGASWDGGFNTPSAVWSDGSSVYVVDSLNERVTKHNAVTGAFVGWRGTIATVPTGGGAACTSALVGDATPGWCTGGTSRVGRALGGFQGMAAISGDANFIYLTDSLNNRVVAFPK
ncbi:MAG: invasin domain 3-containing protein [Bdellovibrionota bacterium]